MINLLKVLSISTPSKIDMLLIIRGLAAVSVLYWHLGGYLAREDFWISFLIIPGRLAVWIFFMMSGYLIGYGLIYGRYKISFCGVKHFYLNRFLRIYPIFFVVSLAALLVHTTNYTIDFPFVLKNLLMFQWDHHYPLNSVFWTLGVEAHLYVIAPLLVFGYRAVLGNGVKWIGLYILVLVALWFYSKLPIFVNWDMRNIMGGIAHFTIGIVLAGYRKEIIQHFGHKKNIVAIMVVLSLVLIGIFNHNYGINLLTILVANIIGVGLITLHVIVEHKEFGVNFGIKALHQLGVLSYGIYAWHGFLITNNYFIDNFFAHFIATLIMAYITYLIVERPVLALKKL